MKLFALTIASALVLTGSALARDRHLSANDRTPTPTMTDPGLLPLDVSEDAGRARKTYHWPDARYYGEHGMMFD